MRLLFLGFWDKRLGILGAIGSTITFVTTVSIIPFMPNGWDPAAGFPAMAGNVPFLSKDLVLLAVSIYLLKQDVVRVSLEARSSKHGERVHDEMPTGCPHLVGDGGAEDRRLDLDGLEAVLEQIEQGLAGRLAAGAA